ncbi:hypothetical protein JOD24_000690 [Kroppenstedtia sanguinis]
MSGGRESCTAKATLLQSRWAEESWNRGGTTGTTI